MIGRSPPVVFLDAGFVHPKSHQDVDAGQTLRVRLQGVDLVLQGKLIGLPLLLAQKNAPYDPQGKKLGPGLQGYKDPAP